MTLIAAVAMVAGLSWAQAETLPLPETVIGLTTPEGEALLFGAEARSDYFPLSIHFTTQVNPAYCGPATIAMVLNALDSLSSIYDLTGWPALVKLHHCLKDFDHGTVCALGRWGHSHVDAAGCDTHLGCRLCGPDGARTGDRPVPLCLDPGVS